MSKSQTELLSIRWLEADEVVYKALIARKLGVGEQHAVDDIWQELLVATEKASRESERIEVPKAWVRQVTKS